MTNTPSKQNSPSLVSGDATSNSLVPHIPLTEYYPDESARHQWVCGVFDRTAVDYDRIEKIMAFGTGPWYRRQALRRSGLDVGMNVLDVGIGTGLTAVEAVVLTGDAKRVVGVDPSAGMLAAAKLPEGVRLLEGRAEALPVDDAQFDFVSMGFALRHVADIHLAFSEFYRALRPGGRVCVLEITRPKSRFKQWWMKLYMRRLTPLLARLFGRTREMPQLMRYYWDTIEACVPPEQVIAALSAVGFQQVERYVELGIFSEYRGIKPNLSDV